MAEYDLILDGSRTPGFEEISDYIQEPAALLWQQFHTFIQENFGASPRITFSTCSGKPGWNVKYQKSGRSICTAYPEKEAFVVLVVIPLDLLPLVEALETSPPIPDIIKAAKPFNRTLWLMIPVTGEAVLKSVQELLLLKLTAKRRKKQ